MIVALWINQLIGNVHYHQDRRQLREQMEAVCQDQIKIRESILDLRQRDLEQLRTVQKILGIWDDLKEMARKVLEEHEAGSGSRAGEKRL